MTSLVLLGPWLFQRALRPWLMWWEAGLPVPGSDAVQDVVLGRAGGPAAAPGWLTIGVLVLAVVALVPRATRPGVQLAWLVALIGLAVALAGTVVTYSTAPDSVAVTPWVAVPAVMWIGALATAVLLAVPATDAWPRPALAAAVVLALVLPLGTGAWWLGRGMDDPLDDQPSATVPAFIAERPGNTLVVTGSIADGVDYRVVVGDGPFLGQEAFTPSASASDEVGRALRRLLAQSTAPEIERLARGRYRRHLRARRGPGTDPTDRRGAAAQADRQRRARPPGCGPSTLSRSSPSRPPRGGTRC